MSVMWTFIVGPKGYMSVMWTFILGPKGYMSVMWTFILGPKGYMYVTVYGHSYEVQCSINMCVKLHLGSMQVPSCICVNVMQCLHEGYVGALCKAQ